jgi:hypothetical protein
MAATGNLALSAVVLQPLLLYKGGQKVFKKRPIRPKIQSNKGDAMFFVPKNPRFELISHVS